MLYRHMTVYYGICRDIRSAGFQMLGIYILDKLSMFQNMQDYTVTDINDYASECTLLVDGTKIYCFSKELLACIEMCVAY